MWHTGESCGWLKIPDWDSAACICKSPTIMEFDGNCICPVGYVISGEACIPCPVNRYSSTSNSRHCLNCNAGYIAPIGASECNHCPNGQFRSFTQIECASCSVGWYARNATNPWSCVECNKQCIKGKYSIPCPSNEDRSDLFKCLPCATLPTNAIWSIGCNYDCNRGFYHTVDKMCEACNTSLCEPGKLRSACTINKDSDCDTDCTNETKPLFYSTWKIGCEWECIPGYCMSMRDYLVFKIWECIRCIGL